jgi:hypothetical protein
MSLLPPAGAPTKKRTVFDGYAGCAIAGAAVSAATAMAVKRNIDCIECPVIFRNRRTGRAKT